MQSAERPSCLIATCESWWSTATLPALLDKRFAVTGLSPGSLSLSRHVRRKVTCSRDPVAAAAALRDLVAKKRFDWVIVADDALFRALLESGSRERLRSWFPVDPERDDLIALVSSKHAFAERAAEFAVPVPESRTATTVEACCRQAAARGYPLVVKGPHGFSGSEVCLAATEDALRRACERFFERHATVLLQRFVDGPSASAAVRYQHGNALAYKAYVTECAFPREHSAGTVHRAFHHPSVEPIVRAVGAATGFHGMAGIDFVRDAKTDEIFVLEVNPRPTSAFAGIREDRAFFGPAVARFVGEQGGPVRVYDLNGRVQVYFPSYAFYFLGHESKRDPAAYRRLLSCLGEARDVEVPLAAWELARYAARFAYDRIGERSPRLRAWIDARRGAL